MTQKEEMKELRNKIIELELEVMKLKLNQIQPCQPYTIPYRYEPFWTNPYYPQFPTITC